jgi:F0F1-type ATP synthase membrane subunit c/vacuolar-type H+-ATPase subunit K
MEAPFLSETGLIVLMGGMFVFAGGAGVVIFSFIRDNSLTQEQIRNRFIFLGIIEAAALLALLGGIKLSGI